MIYSLGIRGYDIACNLTYDIKYLIVGVHSVIEVERSIIKLVSFGKIAFFEGDNLTHKRMGKVMLKSGIVVIKICHYFEFFL